MLDLILDLQKDIAAAKEVDKVLPYFTASKADHPYVFDQYGVRSDDAWLLTGLDSLGDGEQGYMTGAVAQSVVAARSLLPVLVGHCKRLVEWQQSVSAAVQNLPEFHTGEWTGDKAGWGYHVEVINWLIRDRKEQRDAHNEVRCGHCDLLRYRINELKQQRDEARESLAAYKEATNIVSDVAYIDKLNRGPRE